jgi:hypothetical protein
MTAAEFKKKWGRSRAEHEIIQEKSMNRNDAIAQQQAMQARQHWVWACIAFSLAGFFDRRFRDLSFWRKAAGHCQ